MHVVQISIFLENKVEKDINSKFTSFPISFNKFIYLNIYQVYK